MLTTNILWTFFQYLKVDEKVGRGPEFRAKPSWKIYLYNTFKKKNLSNYLKGIILLIFHFASFQHGSFREELFRLAQGYIIYSCIVILQVYEWYLSKMKGRSVSDCTLWVSWHCSSLTYERECNLLWHHRGSQPWENSTPNLSVHHSITERNYIIRKEDNNHAVMRA